VGNLSRLVTYELAESVKYGDEVGDSIRCEFSRMDIGALSSRSLWSLDDGWDG
jgi:hypothetical protein